MSLKVTVAATGGALTLLFAGCASDTVDEQPVVPVASVEKAALDVGVIGGDIPFADRNTEGGCVIGHTDGPAGQEDYTGEISCFVADQTAAAVDCSVEPRGFIAKQYYAANCP